MRLTPPNTPFWLKVTAILAATFLLVFVVLAGRDAWIASRSEKPITASGERQTVIVRDPIQPGQLPRGWNAGQQPGQVVITPVEFPVRTTEQGVQVVYIRDTIRVPVPEAIANDSTLRITPDQPVTVHRPLIGDASVSVATYNPRTQSYETLQYRVPEHPVKYGAAVDAYYATQVLALDSLGGSYVGAGATVYAGYRRVLPFIRVDLDSRNGVTARAGIRYRMGR